MRLIGSAPSRSSLARSWAELIVKLPLMSAPLSPLIPSGYCLKSMNGTVISWLSSATAKCWLSVCPRPLTRSAAVGDVRRDVLELALALAAEAERDVGLAGVRVGALLRIGDLVAAQRDVVLEHEELGVGSPIGVGLEKFCRDRLQHDRAPRDGQDLALGGAHARRQPRQQVRLVVVGARQQAVLARRPAPCRWPWPPPAQAALPGAPNIQYCGRDARVRGCSSSPAAWTASVDRVVEVHAARARAARRLARARPG